MGYTDSAISQTTSAYGSVTRSGTGTVTGMSMTPVSMGVSSAVSLNEANSHSATSSINNSFGYSDSIQALRSYTTQTADKSMTGFTRLLNTTLNQQSSLQSTDSHSNQSSVSMSSGTDQSLGRNFNNAQNATVQSSLNFSANGNSFDQIGPNINFGEAISGHNQLNTNQLSTSSLGAFNSNQKNGLNSTTAGVTGQITTGQQLIDCLLYTSPSPRDN